MGVAVAASLVKPQISEKNTEMQEKLSGMTRLPDINCAATCLKTIQSR